MVPRSGGRDVGLDFRVDRDSLIRDISNISVVVVSSVADMLGSAIRKGYTVRSLNVAVAVSILSSIERSVGVVVSNSVLIAVGLGDLILDCVRGRGMGNNSRSMVNNRSMMDNRGMGNKSGSMVNNGGMMDKGCMGNNGGSMVDNRGMGNHGGSVVNNGGMVGTSSMEERGMVGYSMGNRMGSIVDDSTMSRGNLSQSLAVVNLVNSCMASSEGLGNLDRPDFPISLSD